MRGAASASPLQPPRDVCLSPSRAVPRGFAAPLHPQEARQGCLVVFSDLVRVKRKGHVCICWGPHRLPAYCLFIDRIWLPEGPRAEHTISTPSGEMRMEYSGGKTCVLRGEVQFLKKYFAYLSASTIPPPCPLAGAHHPRCSWWSAGSSIHLSPNTQHNSRGPINLQFWVGPPATLRGPPLRLHWLFL